MPGRAVHQGIDDGFYVGRAFLNIVLRMFIQAAAAGTCVDPYKRGQIVIRSGASQNIEVALDRASLLLNGRIIPIGKAGKDYAILVIVKPSHTGILKAGKD